MTVVFVHGVPEVAAIWDGLLAALGRDDAMTLSPPGFGAPLPDGFDTTSDGYRDWLVAELGRFAEPVDLVGHDWGGGHVMRAATARPDLVRSLVTDIAGIGHPDYAWHDLAQGWQTPGVGEDIVASMAAMSVDDRTGVLVGAGMTETAARACASADQDVMGRCILSLYRSAVQPNMTRWAEEFAATEGRPRTLVVAAGEDAYVGGPAFAHDVAAGWGATVAELDGLGHWWMLQDPARSAAMLRDFLG